MPGMFDNYDNIYSNACQPCPPKPECKLDPCKPDKPYAQYDVKGNLIGYWWNYGDTINLEFNIDGEVVFTESDKDITPTRESPIFTFNELIKVDKLAGITILVST